MKTEETLRTALQREAEKHRVNPALPPKTLARARVRRSVMFMGVTVFVASAVAGGFGVLEYLDRPSSGTPPASNSSSGEEDTSGSESRSGDGTPLLLLTEGGWRVTYVDEYRVNEGEMAFTDGTREMELHWIPARFHESRVEDRENGSARSWDETILGNEAVLFQYEGTTDYTALWLDGDLSFELRGTFPNVEDYRAVAHTLQFVDEETWLAALPESVVRPSERAATVDEMLADIPVHPNANVDELKTDSAVKDRYQLGAKVTSAVACEWIEQWIDAKNAGKNGQAQEAVDAMATSRDWSILVEMKPQGGWSEVVWDYADRMADNDQGLARESTVEDKPSEDGVVVLGYASALGC